MLLAFIRGFWFRAREKAARQPRPRCRRRPFDEQIAFRLHSSSHLSWANYPRVQLCPPLPSTPHPPPPSPESMRFPASYCNAFQLAPSCGWSTEVAKMTCNNNNNHNINSNFYNRRREGENAPQFRQSQWTSPKASPEIPLWLFWKTNNTEKME